MARAAKAVENFSTPLEEDVPCPFFVVGSPEWIEKSFEKGALLPEEIIYIRKPEDLQFFKDWLLATLERAIDTETTGPVQGKDETGYNMNPMNEDTEMVVFQVGDKVKTYILQPYLLIYCKEELEADGHINILHNAAYDWKWLFIKYGIHLPNIFCTMIAEQVSTSGMNGTRVNLQDTTRRHYPHYLISKAVRSEFINYKGFMTRRMVKYGARDCVLLHPLKEDQLKTFTQYNLHNTAQLEFDIIPCTAELEMDGILLDISRIKIIIDYWLMREKEHSANILSLYDKELKQLGKGANFLVEGLTDVFDLKSNKDKLRALAEMGFDLDNVKRETLKETDHKLAKMLAEYSAIMKKTSTYGQNMLNKVNKWTGKWHPKFHQMGAGDYQSSGKENKETGATGRFSGDAQQFPRPEPIYCKATQEEIAFLNMNFSEQLNDATKSN